MDKIRSCEFCMFRWQDRKTKKNYCVYLTDDSQDIETFGNNMILIDNVKDGEECLVYEDYDEN